MAKEFGIAIQPWSPLGGGFLTGKYRRTKDGIEGSGRVQDVKNSGNPVLENFAKDERNWDILAALTEEAKKHDLSPAAIALRWVTSRRDVSGTLIGATRMDQLDANLAALALDLPDDLIRRLEEVSRPTPTELDHFGHPVLQSWISAGTKIR